MMRSSNWGLWLALVALFLLVLPCACNEDEDETSTDGDQDTAGEQNEQMEQETDNKQAGSCAIPFADQDDYGPYSVGAMSVTFQDAAKGRAEAITGTIWYPATVKDGTPYKYQGLIKSDHALKDVALADAGPFPLIVFSHGYQGFAEQSFFFTEFMASHGFIVAACDHIGNTTGTNDEEHMGHMVQQRPQDLSIMIDQMLKDNADSSNRFYGKVDASRIAAVGHSFGGFTVLYLASGFIAPELTEEQCSLPADQRPVACLLVKLEQLSQIDMDLDVSDKRVKAILPMAGVGMGIFGQANFDRITIPVMVMVGDDDKTVPYDQQSAVYYQVLDTDKAYFLMHHAGHFTFSNMCYVAPQMGDGCGQDYLEFDRASYLINRYALSFLRYELCGDMRDAAELRFEVSKSFSEITYEESLGLPEDGQK